MVLAKNLAQLGLGAFLFFAGNSHLYSNRKEFEAQVPTYLPLDPEFVVVASGLVEMALGLLLFITVFEFKKYRELIGLITAIFFILIFPGNINQYVNGIDAFGLDTDQKRLIRLFFQPLLVIWALWASGGLKYLAQFRRKN
ncbi:MAG: hypothetical protein EBV27_05455 [Actinobacteria bacterium]|jgi:uncharacterized membrane protein|nr:hypothetical protein [Actinomycetota bacterium]